MYSVLGDRVGLRERLHHGQQGMQCSQFSLFMDVIILQQIHPGPSITLVVSNLTRQLGALLQAEDVAITPARLLAHQIAVLEANLAMTSKDLKPKQNKQLIFGANEFENNKQTFAQPN